MWVVAKGNRNPPSTKIFLYHIEAIFNPAKPQTLQQQKTKVNLLPEICNMAVNQLEWSTMFSSQVWVERAEDRDSCQSANMALHACWTSGAPANIQRRLYVKTEFK